MKNKVYAIIVLIFTIFSIYTQAQSTQGKEFWLSFMCNADVDSYNTMKPIIGVDYDSLFTKVTISTKKATKITISNPNIATTTWSITDNIPANTLKIYNIPKQYAYSYNDRNIHTQNTGILVTSEEDVSVYASNYHPASFDATNVLPTTALLDNYIIQTYTGLSISTYNWGGAFLIVATENNTKVDITPTAATADGHAANTLYTITLNRGQVYHVLTSGNQDFSGTRIKAQNCKKIAVFSGNGLTFIPTASGQSDFLVEQMFPVSYWGKNFMIVNSKTRDADRIKITSTSSTTTNVKRNGTLITTLGPYSSYEFELTSTDLSAYLESDNPIAVVLYFTGGKYKDSNGDPSMVWINPIEQMINEITFATFEEYSTLSHYVNVIIKTNAKNSVSLDGNPVAATNFVAINGNANYSYARLPISHASHTLKCDSGFIATVYGLKQYESYSYSVGSAAKNLIRQMYINNEIELQQLQYCPNQNIKFQATAEDLVTTVIWDFGDGSAKETKNRTDSVYHKYTNYGTYTVRMILDLSAYCGGYDTITKQIVISQLNSSYKDTICQGTSYNFSGDFINVYSDTVLKKTYVTIYGCDSTVTCNLRVLPAYTLQMGNYTKIVDEICSNQPYNQYGFNIPADTTSGIIKDTLYTQTKLGCDSMVVLTLTRHNLIKTEFSDTACSKYVWVGQTYTKTCDTTRVFQTRYGCDSTVTLHLLIKLPKDTTFADTACQIYRWNGKEYKTSGLYTQVFTGVNQCDSIVNIKLIVYDTTVSIHYVEDDLCHNEYATLTAVSSLTDYLWTTGEMTSSIKVDSGGVYGVTVMLQKCKGSVQITLNSCDFEIKIPNVFTPNGDGINDEFYPETEGVVSEEMYIYDRWGRLIYKWTEVGGKWGGTNMGGSEVQAGVYYYVYKVKGPYDKEMVKNGSITIIR